MRRKHVLTLLFTTLAGIGLLTAAAQGPGGLMSDVHKLGFNHDSLTREVERIPGGIRAMTTTSDETLVEPLRNHPRDMWAHLQAGGRVRMWDPLFREIIAHHEAITMTFQDVSGGILVEVTTEDPEVEKLIAAHADKVSDFAERGHEAMREPTPLPDDYKADEAQPQGRGGRGPGGGRGCCRGGGGCGGKGGGCGGGAGRGGNRAN